MCVVPVGWACLLHPDVRQMRIVHAEIAIELSEQRFAGER